jgi:hypothetical protein
MVELEEAIQRIQDYGLYEVVPVDYDKPKSAKMVNEMSNLRKALTGLPMNLWIDDEGWYKESGHYKRIKFQLDHDKKLNHNLLSDMDLNGVIRVKLPKKVALDNKSLRQLSCWVRNNKYALELLADARIWLTDIIPYLIRGGELATEEQKEKLRMKCDELLELENTDEERN